MDARLRQWLGSKPGDRLGLSLEADGLRLRLHGSGKTSSARALIGCSGTNLLRSEGCGCFATLDRALVKAVAGRQLQPAVHLV